MPDTLQAVLMGYALGFAFGWVARVTPKWFHKLFNKE